MNIRVRRTWLLWLLPAAFGCVEKGDTKISSGEKERAAGEDSSLCARWCDKVADACPSTPNCESNCVGSAARCTETADEFLRCSLEDDHPIECDSVGNASAPDCETEAVEFFDCLNFGGSELQAEAKACEEEDDCGSCCADAFEDGSEQWDAVQEDCSCGGSCDDECGDYCGGGEPSLECLDCTTECIHDTCVFGEEACGAFLVCSYACPDGSFDEEDSTDIDVGDIEEAETAAPSAEVRRAYERVAELQCENFERCQPVDFLVGGPADQAHCAEVMSQIWEAETALADTGITLELLEECAQAWSDMSCEEARRPTPAGPPCWYPGSRENGQPCSSNTQCESGWCQAPSLSCGTCEAFPEEQNPCSHWTECPSGMYCIDERCVTAGMPGDECNDATPCYGYASCNDGVCVWRGMQTLATSAVANLVRHCATARTTAWTATPMTSVKCCCVTKATARHSRLTCHPLARSARAHCANKGAAAWTASAKPPSPVRPVTTNKARPAPGRGPALTASAGVSPSGKPVPTERPLDALRTT